MAMKLKEVEAEFAKVREEFKALKDFVMQELAKAPTPELHPQPVAKTTETVTQTVEKKEETLVYPVPREYREAVERKFNNKFNVVMNYENGNEDFNLIVPDKYSDLSPERKKVSGGYDRRRKIIPPYQGINGVEEYLDLVWKSFNPTIQAMIVSDRVSQ